ncbi:MAG: hypothetical protein E7101_05395 [Prevotella ruminicola]|jgi:hypothetical protein|uniref:Uncharacterized protein n=1 Tax=Xylanibacter ruminicola TaxID=839 RepID=A0A9D5NZE8_XYLRU|nr:hypothetical protein [Xylanibacter ruminicola]
MRNLFGIEIKCCCASCDHKEIDYEGERTCKLMGLKVQQTFKCSKWQISYGMSKAGSAQGVVRHIITKEIIID